jgi:hypothetical protein
MPACLGRLPVRLKGHCKKTISKQDTIRPVPLDVLQASGWPQWPNGEAGKDLSYKKSYGQRTVFLDRKK